MKSCQQEEKERSKDVEFRSVWKWNLNPPEWQLGMLTTALHYVEFTFSLDVQQKIKKLTFAPE
jgi:hypothetical protein